MEHSYRFYRNNACKYFPCHAVQNTDEFNCMFCYCPLYAMGDKCGGIFRYSASGVKNCSNCNLTHSPEYYDIIIAKLNEWRSGKC